MTDFEIAEAQRQQLLERGWVNLPSALPPPLLERWRALADRFEAAALRGHAAGEPPQGACVVQDSVGPWLMRQDDILVLEPEATLALLACPAMMAVARVLCGRGTVPLQADLLYKNPHPHSAILWHQGAPHPRGFPYLNVGIYLDDADPGDGCLRYVPATQHGLQDICAVARDHGWVPDGVVEQPARAGDILIQDMMVLHGSPPKRTPGPRRTIYVELRPVDGIRESGFQSENWADLRARWMGLVVRRADAGAWPEAWRADLPQDLGSDEAEIRAICEHPEPPIPAVYCPQPIETPDYPVPSDLLHTDGAE